MQSSTFVDNMKLPIHRWFRYTAGFSADWAEEMIRAELAYLGAGVKDDMRVLDPFAGSGTTLLAADNVGIKSFGFES